MSAHALIRLLILAGCGFAAPAAGAIDIWMRESEITAAFHDVTVDGRYADGKSFVERYRHDGRIEYSENGFKIGGRWSVTAGTLCTIYDSDADGGCYRVARVAENCFEFFFAARTEDDAPGPDQARPRWTARGSITGRMPTCPEGADV